MSGRVKPRNAKRRLQGDAAMDRTDWILVLLLWGAGLGAAAQYGKISVIFDLLPKVYPNAGATLGFAVSLVGAIGILLGIVAGVVVARIGYRRAILAALFVGAVMSAVQAVWPPLPVFLGTRILEGATHLAIVVAAPTYIAQLSSQRDRAFTMTLWGSFFGVAFAVLAWGGLPMVNAFGPGSLMAAHAAFMALMGVVLWLRLPRLNNTPAALPAIRDLITAHKTLYRSPHIGAPAWGWLFYTICFLSFLTLLPAIVTPQWRAFTIGAVPLVSILASLTLGVWLTRISGSIAAILVGFAIAAICSGALILWPGGPALPLLIGVGLGLVQGATFAAVPHLNTAPAYRALANGGLAQMGNLGNTIGTPLMLAILTSAGQGVMLLVLALLLAAGALAHLAFARMRVSRR